MAVSGKKIPHFITPMLATAVDKPFSSNEWLFELKLDGYRAIAELRNGKLLFYSRNGLSLIKRYPPIVVALRKLKMDMVLDGEIVLLNEKGKPDFQKLQNYSRNNSYSLAYYVFDILSFEGNDLKDLPLIERKKIVEEGVAQNRYSTFLQSYRRAWRGFLPGRKSRRHGRYYCQKN